MGKFDNIFIVSDIDNTFTAQDRTVPVRNLEALSYFKSEGGRFTFATGRSHMSLLNTFPQAKELLNAPAILGNGSYLYDFTCDKVLEPMYLEKELALNVGRLIIDTYSDTGVRILTPETTIYSLVNKYISHELENAWYRNISVFQDPKDWTGEHWCKIVVRDDADKLEFLRNLIEAVFWKKDIEMCKSEVDFLEIQAKGSNKGRGLDVLREMCLKGDTDVKIYACGDFENDLTMLEKADVAVCPSNAEESVKDISDLCLCSCNDGLIADLIERL